jgi:DNA-binding NarL/FixJ family response regulator
VLFLSAHHDEAYIVEAVNAGAMGYLIKQTSADCVRKHIFQPIHPKASSQTESGEVDGLAGA